LVFPAPAAWSPGRPAAAPDLNDKFGAIGATAMTRAAGLQTIPQGGELNAFRIVE
jgi:lanthanide-dependent methanol dehydrogenase